MVRKAAVQAGINWEPNNKTRGLAFLSTWFFVAGHLEVLREACFEVPGQALEVGSALLLRLQLPREEANLRMGTARIIS